MTAANLKARSNQEDQKRAACDALTSAKDHFYEHLARLGTSETLQLAQAVIHAESAADVEHGEAAQTLLTMASNARENPDPAALDAIVEAKNALYDHLEKMATPETLRLFQAVYDAETDLGVEHTEAGYVLLRPKAAA